jgi:hypothetical protein
MDASSSYLKNGTDDLLETYAVDPGNLWSGEKGSPLKCYPLHTVYFLAVKGRKGGRERGRDRLPVSERQHPHTTTTHTGRSILSQTSCQNSLVEGKIGD